MIFKKQKLFFNLLFINSLMALMACSPSKLERAFQYCLEGEPSTFNPQMAVDGDTFDASSQTVYNRLIGFKSGTTDLKPSLAERWQIFDNGKKVRFFLKPNIEFHRNDIFKPTRALNSEDVLFSFKRMRDTNHPYHNVGVGRYTYFESSGISHLLENVVRVSDLVVDFKLKNSDATFLSSLAMDFASILSKEYADFLLEADQKELLDFKPIGTGPFVFKNYKESSRVYYEGNKKYFETPPKIKNLIIKIIPNGAQRVNMLLDGACDFIKSPPLESISKLEKNKRIRVIDSRTLNVSYIAFNNEKSKFKNREVRKAIAQALDRKKYINHVYSGRAELAQVPLPPQVWAYDESIKPTINFNLDESKKTLKKFYPKNNLKIELWILPIARPYLPNASLLAKYIKRDLQRVDVDVNLVTYDWNSFLEKISLSEHEMILYGWTGDSGDPDNFLNLLLSCSAVNGGNNLAKFCHPVYDRHILSAKKNVNRKIRKEEYTKALKVFRQELPLIPIAHSKNLKVMRSEVQGYIPSPFGTESFKDVYLKDWSKE